MAAFILSVLLDAPGTVEGEIEFTSGLSWCFSGDELSSVRAETSLWQGQGLVSWNVPILIVCLESLP